MKNYASLKRLTKSILPLVNLFHIHIHMCVVLVRLKIHLNNVFLFYIDSPTDRMSVSVGVVRVRLVLSPATKCVTHRRSRRRGDLK